jgi:hypothetical protein
MLSLSKHGTRGSPFDRLRAGSHMWSGHQPRARATASRMAWWVRSRISGVTEMRPE